MSFGADCTNHEGKFEIKGHRRLKEVKVARNIFSFRL